MATQANRPIEFTTPLGPDVLLVRSFSVNEQLGRLFQIDLDLVSTDENINFDDVLGQNATVRVDLPNAEPRYFNGMVNRFVQAKHDGDFAHYQATLVPWLWFLTRQADCRIFQSTMQGPPADMTAPSIIKKVFTDAGFHDFKDALHETYATRDYCVQYRETDFNFVSRLMEQEGIYYYFEHADGKHTAVLSDSIGAHEASPGYETIFYRPELNTIVDLECISDWSKTAEVRTGKYTLNDFDFKKPRNSLFTSSRIVADHAVPNFEMYDFPGDYVDLADGEAYARIRIEELNANYEVMRGRSNARGIRSGSTFSLEDFPRSDQNCEYLVTGTVYHFDAGDFVSGGSGSAAGEFCECTFTAIPSRVTFRAERSTPKPSIQGVQTAIVVGPAGEEIYVDEYGRVKVQFHWDRLGKKDENSSCWVRVSHANAGKTWGSIHSPRVGQEVIVEFLEGDPDRPIITGRVYNADQMPPYALPENKTQSGIKTRSSRGGSAANFNEIRFEDKKGQEQLYVHAEKNQDNVVENDETTNVGHDRTETVGNNETIMIGANRTITVSQSETATVAVQRTHSVGANETISIGVAQEITIGALQNITVGANQQTSVGKDQKSSVGSNRSADVGKDDNLKVAKNLVIDAGDSVTIKTGDASITMKKDGTITIKGKDISIDGSGKINVKASSDVVIKGSKVGLN